VDIRRFTSADLHAVIELQRQVLPDGAWTEDDFQVLGLQPGGLILLAEPGQARSLAVVGLAVARQIGAEAEILILAVALGHQRQGVGRLLLSSIWRELEQLGVKHVYLEVRASNRPAIKLYTSVGFMLSYIRNNYYAHPVEDAYVMSLEIPFVRSRMTGRSIAGESENG
jgi:[ribosomal protein S18]-alanine N-acetyltransferase